MTFSPSQVTFSPSKLLVGSTFLNELLSQLWLSSTFRKGRTQQLVFGGDLTRLLASCLVKLSSPVPWITSVNVLEFVHFSGLVYSPSRFLLRFVTVLFIFSSVQFSSVTQLCLTLWDPMNHSTPGLPVHHQLQEFIETHAHQVSDAIQPSHPLSSPSPPAPNPSQH